MKYEAFIEACRNGDLDFIRSFMAKNDPSYGDTGMDAAITSNRVEVAKLLLTDERVRKSINVDLCLHTIRSYAPEIFKLIWQYCDKKNVVLKEYAFYQCSPAVKFVLKDKKIKLPKDMLDFALENYAFTPLKTLEILANDKRTANVSQKSFFRVCEQEDTRILKIILPIFNLGNDIHIYLEKAKSHPNNIAMLVSDKRVYDKLSDIEKEHYPKVAWSHFYNKIIDGYDTVDVFIAINLKLVDPSAFNNWALKYGYKRMQENPSDYGYERQFKLLLSSKKVLAKLRDCVDSKHPLFDIVKDIPKQIDEFSNPGPIGPDPAFDDSDNPTLAGYRRGVDGCIYQSSMFLSPLWYYNLTKTPLQIYFQYFGPLAYRRMSIGDNKALEILKQNVDLMDHYNNWLKGINIYNTTQKSYTYYSFTEGKVIHIPDIYNQKPPSQTYGFKHQAQNNSQPKVSEFTDAEKAEFAKLGLPWTLDQVNELRKSCENSDIKSCYTILQVPSGASLAEISKEFRKLSLKWHPDKPKGHKLYYQAITSAYTKLKSVLS